MAIDTRPQEVIQQDAAEQARTLSRAALEGNNLFLVGQNDYRNTIDDTQTIEIIASETPSGITYLPVEGAIQQEAINSAGEELPNAIGQAISAQIQSGAWTMPEGAERPHKNGAPIPNDKWAAFEQSILIQIAQAKAQDIETQLRQSGRITQGYAIYVPNDNPEQPIIQDFIPTDKVYDLIEKHPELSFASARASHNTAPGLATFRSTETETNLSPQVIPIMDGLYELALDHYDGQLSLRDLLEGETKSGKHNVAALLGMSQENYNTLIAPYRADPSDPNSAIDFSHPPLNEIGSTKFDFSESTDQQRFLHNFILVLHPENTEQRNKLLRHIPQALEGNDRITPSDQHSARPQQALTNYASNAADYLGDVNIYHRYGPDNTIFHQDLREIDPQTSLASGDINSTTFNIANAATVHTTVDDAISTGENFIRVLEEQGEHKLAEEVRTAVHALERNNINLYSEDGTITITKYPEDFTREDYWTPELEASIDTYLSIIQQSDVAAAFEKHRTSLPQDAWFSEDRDDAEQKRRDFETNIGLLEQVHQANATSIPLQALEDKSALLHQKVYSKYFDMPETYTHMVMNVTTNDPALSYALRQYHSLDLAQQAAFSRDFAEISGGITIDQALGALERSKQPDTDEQVRQLAEAANVIRLAELYNEALDKRLVEGEKIEIADSSPNSLEEARTQAFALLIDPKFENVLATLHEEFPTIGDYQHNSVGANTLAALHGFNGSDMHLRYSIAQRFGAEYVDDTPKELETLALVAGFKDFAAQYDKEHPELNITDFDVNNPDLTDPEFVEAIAQIIFSGQDFLNSTAMQQLKHLDHSAYNSFKEAVKAVPNSKYNPTTPTPSPDPAPTPDSPAALGGEDGHDHDDDDHDHGGSGGSRPAPAPVAPAKPPAEDPNVRIAGDGGTRRESGATGPGLKATAADLSARIRDLQKAFNAVPEDERRDHFGVGGPDMEITGKYDDVDDFLARFIGSEALKERLERGHDITVEHAGKSYTIDNEGNVYNGKDAKDDPEFNLFTDVDKTGKHPATLALLLNLAEEEQQEALAEYRRKMRTAYETRINDAMEHVGLEPAEAASVLKGLQGSNSKEAFTDKLKKSYEGVLDETGIALLAEELWAAEQSFRHARDNPDYDDILSDNIHFAGFNTFAAALDIVSYNVTGKMTDIRALEHKDPGSGDEPYVDDRVFNSRIYALIERGQPIDGELLLAGNMSGQTYKGESSISADISFDPNDREDRQALAEIAIERIILDAQKAGIPAQDISSAMFSGEFNPYEGDLAFIYENLVQYEDLTAADFDPDDIARWKELGIMNPGDDVPPRSFAIPVLNRLRDDAWNQHFGEMPGFGQSVTAHMNGEQHTLRGEDIALRYLMRTDIAYIGHNYGVNTADASLTYEKALEMVPADKRDAFRQEIEGVMSERSAYDYFFNNRVSPHATTNFNFHRDYYENRKEYIAENAERINGVERDRERMADDGADGPGGKPERVNTPDDTRQQFRVDAVDTGGGCGVEPPPPTPEPEQRINTPK